MQGLPQLPTFNAAQPLHMAQAGQALPPPRLSLRQAGGRQQEGGAELPSVQGCKPLEQQSHEPAPGQIYSTSQLCKQQQCQGDSIPRAGPWEPLLRQHPYAFTTGC